MTLPFFLRRSLSRRLLVTTFLAFSFLWPVMMIEQVIETDHAFVQQTELLGQAMLKQFEPIVDAQEAQASMRAISISQNDTLRTGEVPGSELMELSDAQGKVLYRSPEAGANRLSDAPDGSSVKTVDGVKYDLFKGHTGRWTVVLCAPVWNLSMVIGAIGSQMWFYMMLEFPFVFVPIWFVMSRGMRPLRKLSDEVAARDENDLRPIASDAKYEEIKPMSQALDRLLARLRGKIEREHAFVQDAAHELRTPLAVISAQAHVLALAATPEARGEAEQRMDHAIARASHLVQQLLMLAHVDGQRPLAREPLDLAQLLRQELAVAAATAMKRGIDLSLDASDKLPAEVEREAFLSIVHNLLDNAIRYVQPGGQVAVALQRRDDRCILAVADNGPGIAPRERDKVFERFYRVAGNDTPGSGLGLSIVKQAAERLGGKVSLDEGIEGRGCSFAVDIPVA